MKNINWNDVQEATERRDLPAGGYVAGIRKATDEPAKSVEFHSFPFSDY